MRVPLSLLSLLGRSPPAAAPAAAAPTKFTFIPMRQGIHSRLFSSRPGEPAFEALYRLRRRVQGGPTSVVAASSAANSDEWRLRVVEYALPDSWDWQPDDGDTLCTAFTDINSRFTFLFAVYTRLTPVDGVEVSDSFIECLALVTRRPGFDIFPALLRQLATGQWPVDPVLAISHQLAASATMGQPIGHRDCQLPDTGHWGPVRELSDRLGRNPDILLYLLTAMLTERKILLVARRLDCLTLCAFGCVSMLYPFSWEHVFAPSLSAANIDHIGCLVPCVFGLVEALYAANRDRVDANFADSEFALLNLDTGELYVADGAPASAEQLGLPKRLVRAAKRSLSRAHSSSAPGDTFSQALLCVVVELLAPIRQQPAGSELNLDAFLAASPQSYRPFLRHLSGSQLFREFADRYLAVAAAGQPEDAHYYEAFNRAADRLLASRRRRRAIANLSRSIGRSVRSTFLPGRRSAAQAVQQQQQQRTEAAEESDEFPDDDNEDDVDEVKSADGQAAPVVLLDSGVGEGVLISIDDSDDCGSNSHHDALSVNSASSSSQSIAPSTGVHFVSPHSSNPQQPTVLTDDDWAALIGGSDLAAEPKPAAPETAATTTTAAAASKSGSETDLLQFSSPFKEQILSRYGAGNVRPNSFPTSPAAAGVSRSNNWVSFA